MTEKKHNKNEEIISMFHDPDTHSHFFVKGSIITPENDFLSSSESEVEVKSEDPFVMVFDKKMKQFRTHPVKEFIFMDSINEGVALARSLKWWQKIIGMALYYRTAVIDYIFPPDTEDFMGDRDINWRGLWRCTRITLALCTLLYVAIC